MAISNETAALIVYGADKALHTKIRGAMLRLARNFRDDPANEGELRQKWAQGVLRGGDGHYQAVLREVSLRQAIQDGYVADDHAEGVVQANVLAVLDSVLSAAASV